MELQTRNNKMLFQKLSFIEKKSAIKVIYKTKCKYKRKIIWLATKQQKTNKCTNNALKFYPKSKSLKNKKDRQTHLKRHKHKLLNEENKTFNDLILNKSELELNMTNSYFLLVINSSLLISGRKE